MKRLYGKYKTGGEFKVGDLVLFFNSRLNLFTSKLHSRWSGPVEVNKVLLYGAIRVGTEATDTFKVNGPRLKHYIVGELIDGKVTHDILDVASS